MRDIILDASQWKNIGDFYDAVLAALRAPDWHGRNANALVESIVWGEINEVTAPFRVRIIGSQSLSSDVMQKLASIEDGVKELCEDFRDRRGCDADVSFEVVRQK